MANPLKIDPTRTTTLRRQFAAEFRKRFNRIKGRINRLLIVEDAFGLIDRKTKVTVNTRWRFHTSQEKVLLFQSWLAGQLLQTVLDENGQTVPTEVDDAYWIRYIEEGFKKGAGRAFDDVKKPALSTALSGEVSDFYLGTKQQFLRSAFGQPEAIEKVKLLASRTFTDLKGVTEAVSADLSRVLTDGLVQGQNPRDIAANLNQRIQKIGVVRSETIARTEIIRAHAEGQLHALEELEVEEVGVMVEWSTAGDERVCPLCSSLQGIVVKVKEAHGLIPRHPNCRCSFIPANVGEDQSGQKRGATKLSKARDESIKRELGKNAKGLTQAQRRRASRWAGADTTFAKKRPESILEEKPTPKKKPAAKKPSRKVPSRPAKATRKPKPKPRKAPAPAYAPEKSGRTPDGRAVYVADDLNYVRRRYSEIDQRAVPMLLSTKKVDTAWSIDSGPWGSYIPPGGGGAEIENRRDKFREFLLTHGSKEAPIEMPRLIRVDKVTGAIHFDDGRHRFSVLRDLGVDKIPMLVDRNVVKDFEQFVFIERGK